MEGCKESVKDKFTNSWLIDSIAVAGYNYTDYLMLNTVFCEDNGIFFFFGFQSQILVPKDSMVLHWKVINEDSIEITGKNYMMCGKYAIRIFDDYNTPAIRMTMKSDSIYMFCRKMFISATEQRRLQQGK